MKKTSEIFINWLQQLSNTLNKEFVMGDEASWAIEFQGDITIQLAVNDDTGGFYMHATICDFPKNVSAQYELMHFFLQLNMEQAETLQGSFCLSDDGQTILLTFARPVETYNVTRFIISFLTFFDVCEETKTALQAVIST